MPFMLYLYKRPSEIMQRVQEIMDAEGAEAVDRFIASLPDKEKAAIVKEVAEMMVSLPVIEDAIDKIAFSPS